MRNLRMAMILTAGLMCPALFAAAANIAVVPAPQEIKVGEGAYSAKAKMVDGSLYAFKIDSSLPREGYRISVTGNSVRSR